MTISIHPNDNLMGAAAAAAGAAAIRAAIAERGEARIVVATGASQVRMLAHLTQTFGIDWTRVTIFHLDEYIGLDQNHPASFRRYLDERLLGPLDHTPRFVPVLGDAPDPEAECRRLASLVGEAPFDVVFAGIGENGHLAFNDPPADFSTGEAFVTVNLDERCRLQQVGEGWFRTIDEVPSRAITMTIRRMLESRRMVLSVPTEKKAQAVRVAVEGALTPRCPASILRLHRDCSLYLDSAAASGLEHARTYAVVRQ